MNYYADTILNLIVGVSLGIAITLIAMFLLSDDKLPVECRNGKLYQVSYDGNITIFTPTYDECEEIQ